MQRRAAAMYVLLFLVVAVSALVFINMVDGPSDTLDEADYDLGVDDTVTVDGTDYQVSSIDQFSATLEYVIEEDDRTTTLSDGAIINVSRVEYRVEIPDVDEPENITLVETFPEHDLDTFELDGETYVIIDAEEDEFMEETAYLEQEFGPRDRIVLVEGDTFDYEDQEMDVVVDATVDSISSAGVGISWVGPSSNSLILPRNAVSTIGNTDFGVNFVGEDMIQLSSDIEAFNDHIDALDTWDERYQGFWGIGVLGIIAAILLTGLSYLPRRR